LGSIIGAAVGCFQLDNASCGLNPETIQSPLQPALCFYERNRKLVADMLDESFYHSSNVTGSVMEMVRTFLANWILTRSSNIPAPNWTPLIATDSIEFSNTRTNGDFFWECQCLMQESTAKMEKSCEDMAASPNIIMLFILGFPGTGEVKSSSPESNSFSLKSTDTSSNHQSNGSSNTVIFGSPFAPQDINVSVEELSFNGESKMVMKLVSGNLVDKFMWADWIDAAMGYLKGADEEKDAIKVRSQQTTSSNSKRPLRPARSTS